MSKNQPMPPSRAVAGQPPEPAPADALPSGRVHFDDRGNAVWEWSVATGKFGQEVSGERLRRLEHPALSIAEDAPAPAAAAKPNPAGPVRGYDPYDSGRLDKKTAPRRKKDLRRLSEWIALKNRAAQNKDGED
ncbi:MAG TPA: hypothetical protein VND80_02010 [Steroidobacteraceae bacterium]|nr:hypothetical protein [Steroidobacteraceae bacterium]